MKLPKKAHLKAEQGIIKQLSPEELFINKELFLLSLTRFKNIRIWESKCNEF